MSTIHAIPQDYHIHTNFSCDSQATMTEMCRAAIEQGIREIGFSEHFDLMPEEHCREFFQADSFWEALRRCREEFAGVLTIRAGIELGEPHLFKAEVKQMLDHYPWDYSLASMHWVGSGNIFDPSYFEQSPEQAYKGYFQELATMATEATFDILAHMDMVKRYGFDAYGSYHAQQFENDIRSVLRACAERGLALEVNTATLRRSVQQLAPGKIVLEWFREEGGQWVTLGSDAHLPDQVGYGLERAEDTIRAAGFTYLARFELRRPSPMPISK